jgi:restriction system protein
VRCPRCGGVMQTKEAKKGHSAGKLFWSCAHFPRCRGARPL